MKSSIASVPLLCCSVIVGAFLIDARGQVVEQPAKDKPVLKPAGDRSGRPVQRTADPVRKRPGQVASPANRADKQPRWSAAAATPELPAVAAISQDKARELFERARMMLIERKPQDALPLLKQADALESGRFEIQFLLGVTLGMLGRP